MRYSTIVLILVTALGVQGQLAKRDDGLDGFDDNYDNNYDDNFDDDDNNKGVFDDDDFDAIRQCRQACAPLFPALNDCYARAIDDDDDNDDLAYTDCLCNSQVNRSLISRCGACVAQHDDDDDDDSDYIRRFFAACPQPSTPTTSSPPTVTTGGGGTATTTPIGDDVDDPNDDDYDTDDFFNTTDPGANSDRNNAGSAGSAFQLPSMGIFAITAFVAVAAL